MWGRMMTGDGGTRDGGGDWGIGGLGDREGERGEVQNSTVLVGGRGVVWLTVLDLQRRGTHWSSPLL